MIKGIFWAAVSVLCWGSLFPVGRKLMMAGDVDPASLGMLRFFIAGALMVGAGLIFNRQKLLRPSAKEFAVMACQGIVGASVMSLLLFFAQQRIAAVNSSMLEAIVPLQICLLGLLGGKRFNFVQFTGLIIGFCGCLLVLKVITFSGINLNNLQSGDVMIFFSGLCWATYTMWGRDYINKFGGYTFTAWTILFGGAALGIYNLTRLDVINMPSTAQTWWLTAYMVFIPSALAFFSWNEAQRYISTAFLSISEYFTPLLSALFAWAMLGETITPGQLLGAVVVMGAVIADPELSSELKKRLMPIH